MTEKLYKAFEDGELYKKKGKNLIYPVVIKVDPKRSRTTFVFSLPKGVSPEQFKKRLYVFKQHFGQYIDLDVNEQRGILSVYPEGIPTKFKFNWSDIEKTIKGYKMPIVAGIGMHGKLIAYDMVKENRANLIIIGEPGAGKSTQLRQILTTWIKHVGSDRLKMYLADLKRSEFYLFRNLRNTEVATTEEELLPKLKEIKKEMDKRGTLLDEHEVSHIDDLPFKLPYIALCIDEFSIVSQNNDILKLMQQITSLGRALGIVCIISMQRASHDLIPTVIRSNMNVGMGFRVIDKSNATMIGVDGAENLTIAGRMICNLNGLSEIQAPLLDITNAKKLLKPYKQQITKKKTEQPEQDEYAKVRRLFDE